MLVADDMQEGGAPSPLRAALQGKPGVGFGDEERGDRPARANVSEKTVGAPAGGGVRTAGPLGIGALVVGTVGIVVLGARSLRDLLRG